jgi:AraC-like DNA-binding protein
VTERRALHAASESRIIASYFVPALLRYLQKRGLDVARLCAAHGIDRDASEREMVLLPVGQVRRIGDDAVALSGDPFLGATVARDRRPGSYGVLEFVSRSAPTLGDAIAQILRFQRLVLDHAGIELVVHGGAAKLQHDIGVGAAGVARQASEFALGTEVLFFRSITGRHLCPQRVWFAHARPAGPLDPLVDLFGTRELAFEARSNGVELAAVELELPLVGADAALHDFLARHALRELPQPAEDDVRPALRRVLSRALATGAPSAQAAARALGMTTRTLQRRLADAGTTFQGEVERTRQELATMYLADRTLSIAEVGFLLGYADQRSFLRAFRRWTGTAPSAYRATLPGT